MSLEPADSLVLMRPASGDNRLVLRPRPKSDPDIWVSSLVILLVIAATASGVASGAIGAVAVVAVCVGFILVDLLRVKVVADGEQVRYQDFYGGPTTVDRGVVKTVQIFGYWVALRDMQGETVLRMRPYWSRDQLAELATFLDARLLDRRSHWWRDRRKRRPPSTPG